MHLHWPAFSWRDLRFVVAVEEATFEQLYGDDCENELEKEVDDHDVENVLERVDDAVEDSLRRVKPHHGHVTVDRQVTASIGSSIEDDSCETKRSRKHNHSLLGHGCQMIKKLVNSEKNLQNLLAYGISAALKESVIELIELCK